MIYIINLTSSALAEAVHHLTEALQTFTAIQARFELGRTHVALAALARIQGGQQTTVTHLTKAHALFQALQVPRYVERVVQCASAWGVTLSARTRRRR